MMCTSHVHCASLPWFVSGRFLGVVRDPFVFDSGFSEVFVFRASVALFGLVLLAGRLQRGRVFSLFLLLLGRPLLVLVPPACYLLAGGLSALPRLVVLVAASHLPLRV